ncbi:MAG: response regulator [Coleofasciculaceae cyanobacterium SM2_1_6]|nr:response regulator [Coleofasciculaceae cyanobacterium SM2_1_6]
MSKQVILCVDDEKMILDSLYYQLRQYLGNSYHIETAETGEEAIELLAELHQNQIEIPLIICDQIMPGLKGDELLIKIHAQSPQILKILLTGQASVETVANAVNHANLYRYIAKPWDSVDLCMTITEALRSYEQSKQLVAQNETLKILNASLEQKVVDRTQELTTTNIQLQAEIRDRQLLAEKLRTSEEKIRAIFEAMTDIILVIDEDDNIDIAPINPQNSERMTPLVNATIKQFFVEETRQNWLQIIQQVRDTQQILNLDYSLPLDDQETWFTASISLMPNNAVIWVARNIDERKQAEAATLRAKESAEAANQAKSTFLANMSHELRSPLNAILGFSQVLLNNNVPAPEQAENIKIIYRSGEHLLSLINHVLDLSKIEAGKITLNPENLDLYHLLEDLKDMLHLQAEKAGLELIFDYGTSIPQYIYTDAVKLRQILINLLSNALKFTKAGLVKLQVLSDDFPIATVNNDPFASKSFTSNSFTLKFRVEDTGVGIATEELTHIFEAFSQAQAGREIQEGSGLGLAISRKFAQLLGGDITVTSQLGQGSTFQLVMQTSLGREASAPPMSSGQVIGLVPGQPTYRLLIVDDKSVNRQLLRRFLAPLGFELKEASNGKEAIDLWAAWSPHLIWMDMRMPVMDGYEATKQIKATLQGQATAVIALTASVLEAEKDVILSTGCDDFIRKPFQQQTILDILEKHLGVNYLYAETEIMTLNDLNSGSTKSSTLRELKAQDLTCMPRSWINEFYNAALEADPTQIMQLITTIPSTEAALSQSLIKLARQFKFEQLIELSEPLIMDE